MLVPLQRCRRQSDASSTLIPPRTGAAEGPRAGEQPPGPRAKGQQEGLHRAQGWLEELAVVLLVVEMAPAAKGTALLLVSQREEHLQEGPEAPVAHLRQRAGHTCQW